MLGALLNFQHRTQNIERLRCVAFQAGTKNFVTEGNKGNEENLELARLCRGSAGDSFVAFVNFCFDLVTQPKPVREKGLLIRRLIDITRKLIVAARPRSRKFPSGFVLPK